MKKSVLVAGLVSFVALSGSASAQNVGKLFDPVDITNSTFPDPGTDMEGATDFVSKQLYLQCGANPTGQIEGPFPGGSLIIDNFIQVLSPDNTSLNYCPEPFPEADPGKLGCFTLEPGGNPRAFLGQPVESIYGPVGPQDISASLRSGLGLYSFSLMDFSFAYGSSELFLNTSCAIKDKVCHLDSGKKGSKTLTVGAAAIPAHLNHGDTLGPCVP
jgi:hypothetical protein